MKPNVYYSVIENGDYKLRMVLDMSRIEINHRNFETYSSNGTSNQRLKSGCNSVKPNGRVSKRNPGRIRMKTIGSFQVPIGYGYSHDCPLGEKLANKYMH